MRTLFLALSLVVLTACGSPREMPSNSGSGSDEMRLSPCACLEIEDYDGRGFQWLG